MCFTILLLGVLHISPLSFTRAQGTDPSSYSTISFIVTCHDCWINRNWENIWWLDFTVTVFSLTFTSLLIRRLAKIRSFFCLIGAWKDFLFNSILSATNYYNWFFLIFSACSKSWSTQSLIWDTPEKFVSDSFDLTAFPQ